jgi:hypothetical protein
MKKIVTRGLSLLLVVAWLWAAMPSWAALAAGEASAPVDGWNVSYVGQAD